MAIQTLALSYLLSTLIQWLKLAFKLSLTKHKEGDSEVLVMTWWAIWAFQRTNAYLDLGRRIVIVESDDECNLEVGRTIFSDKCMNVMLKVIGLGHKTKGWSLWGNSKLEFVGHGLIRNSGGILLKWELLSSRKMGTISDKFNSYFTSHNDLISIDKDLERGNVSDDILLNRMDLNRRLQDIKLLEVKDLVSVVRFVVFSLNGTWCTDPSIVKEAFKNHFEVRFQQPCHDRLKLNAPFHNRLSSDQVDELDRAVSRDEIRRAVGTVQE
ncbi:hypothetical protein Tco_0966027 [Tanacetum coccineum]